MAFLARGGCKENPVLCLVSQPLIDPLAMFTLDCEEWVGMMLFACCELAEIQVDECEYLLSLGRLGSHVKQTPVYRTWEDCIGIELPIT